MFTVEELCEKLRQNDQKVTPQRRLIYKALEGKTTHPTADEVWAEVKTVMPDVSLATVYKTLRELVDKGFLVEIRHNNDSSRFDPRTDDHSHLLCIGCNKLEDVSQTFPQLDLAHDQKRGFRMVKNEVIFYGYCPDCQ
jgi:Fe2+ or Zn2+ uptake regulation protein